MALHEYVGGCHCGTASVIFNASREPEQWPLQRCLCSFCVRVGVIYTSDLLGDLDFVSMHPLWRYRFGQQTTDFLFCPGCGVYLGAATTIDGRVLAVLNVRIMDLPLDLAAAKPLDLDEDSPAVRQARRLKSCASAVIRDSNES